MQNRNSRLASTLLVVLAIIFSPSALRADVTGSILGVVHDRTQAVVAGARIVATNVQTNFKLETISAADGSYRILALPAGNYKLTATAAGFQQYTATDIDLKVNDPCTTPQTPGIRVVLSLIAMMHVDVPTTFTTSPYQELARCLGIGTPLRGD